MAKRNITKRKTITGRATAKPAVTFNGLNLAPKLHKGLIAMSRKAGFKGKTGWETYANQVLCSVVGV